MAQLANLTTTLAIESASFVNGIEQSRGAVRRLVASLDPAAAAQAKFNRQMDLAERGLRSGQISADLYGRVVERLKAQLDAASVGGSRLTQTTGSLRGGMQQLSYQLNDVATMWSLGAKPMQIFASQSGQVIQALQIMSGESKGLLGILGGPWGIAISAAASVAIALAGALFKTADASSTAKKASKSLEDAIHDLAVAQGKAIETNYQSRQAALAQAQGMRAQEIQARRTAIALLNATMAAIELNKARIDVAAHDPRISGPLLATNDNLTAQISKIQGDIAKANRGLADANSAIISTKIAIATRDVADANDKASAAATRFEKAQSRLNDEFSTGKITETQYRSELDAATKARDAATKSVESHTRARRSSNAAEREADAIIRSQAKLIASASAGAYKAIVGLDKDQHKALMSAFGEGGKDWDAIAKKAATATKAEQEAEIANERDLQRVREDHIRDLASLYSDLFTGGTKRLWQDFERWGFDVISQLLAKWTVGAVAGGSSGGGIGGLLGSIGKLFGGGGPSLDVGAIRSGADAALASIHIPGFATGGSFQFGGRDGIDKNILSLNGSPIAKVSKGETAMIGRGAANDRGPIVFDLRGAVMTQDLLEQMNSLAASNSIAVVGAAKKAQAKAAARRLGR